MARPITSRAERRAGILLIAGAVLANVAFAGLSAVFDYPDVLQAPPLDVLRSFANRPVVVASLFTLLAAGAGLLGPAAVELARVTHEIRPNGSTWARWARALGIAASTVQVVGLLRWPLLVPLLAETAADPAALPADVTAAADRFAAIHLVLGQVVGESLGYILTAAWTVAAVIALGTSLPMWVRVGGLICVPLILAGLVVPLGWAAADLANLVGYVAWSLWLVALGVLLLRGRMAARSTQRGPEPHESAVPGL
ncbi:DUF4386 family protein [Promicromonospora soli]